MNTALWTLQLLLGSFFPTVGAVKASRHDRALSMTPWAADVPCSPVTFIGNSEMVGGAGLILPARPACVRSSLHLLHSVSWW